ncbi:MAG: DUF5693 family protein [Negativicutes bacterium]|nr:DUF5693 family protein [Negativicutes bacterium]
MADYKYNRTLIALIIAGLLAALAVGWQRHAVEVSNNRVEMAIDYEDIIELALTEGVPAAELLPRFKAAGITTLTVYETTLEKLHKQGLVTVLPGADLIGRIRTGEATALKQGNGQAALPDAAKVYIFGEPGSSGLSARVLAEVKDDLVRRLGAQRVAQLVAGDNRPVLAVDANYEKLVKWNLGLPRHELAAAADYGFHVIVRPSNYTKVQAADVEAVFERIKDFNNITGIMFVGEEVLGFPDLLPLTAARMKERGLTLGMIEHPLQLQFVRQDGLLQLAALNDYRAARVYVIPKDEQVKLKPAEAIHRWAITDPERNIRINLLRKYDKPEPGKTLIETNLDYISGVNEKVAARNFSTGPAGVFAPYFPSRLLLAVIALGATAAGVLFLTLLWPFRRRYQYLLLAVIGAVLAVPILAGGGNAARQAVALASAILFPVLAMTWQLDRWQLKEPYQGHSLAKILVDGLGSLAVAALVSLIGGLYVAAILGDVRFLLEMEIYRGVKLTFIGPVLLITVVFLLRFNLFEREPLRTPRDLWRQLVKILDYPISMKSLLLLGFGALAAWVFIGRSGHTAGVPVPAIELKFRAFLENVMSARPRSKEVFGHPAFLLAAMAFYRNWPRVVQLVLVIGATIALGSMVETFAHLRTPVFMSLTRGFNGLLLGAALGILASIAFQVLHYLTHLLERRTKVYE